MICSKNFLTLFILLDAWSGDYLNPTDSPFLWQLSQESICGPLQPTFGFEPDGAYLAGLYPDEWNGGAHYWKAPEASPFRWIGPLTPVLKFCPNGLVEKTLRRVLTWITRKITAYSFDTVAMIPFELLHYFAPVRPTPEVREAPTIFTLCSENHIPWVSHRYPWFKTGVTAGLNRLKQLIKPPIRFAFWYVSDLDKAGHRYGPLASECRAAVRRVDAGIGQFVSFLKNYYQHLDLIILGDHGMVQVQETVNIAQALAKAGLQSGPEMLYFLDSTMARFWFFKEHLKEEVTTILRGVSGGSVLGQGDRDHYHLNYSHNRFGDLIFIANPEVLISPNFYQGGAMVRGMHGYRPEYPEQQSMIIIHRSECPHYSPITEPLDMRRVFPTTLRLLGLETPDSCRIDSII